MASMSLQRYKKTFVPANFSKEKSALSHNKSSPVSPHTPARRAGRCRGRCQGRSQGRYHGRSAVRRTPCTSAFQTVDGRYFNLLLKFLCHFRNNHYLCERIAIKRIKAYVRQSADHRKAEVNTTVSQRALRRQFDASLRFRCQEPTERRQRC